MTCRSMLTCCAFLLGSVAGAAEPARTDGWLQNDFAAAQNESRKTGKPIFVVFRCER